MNDNFYTWVNRWYIYALGLAIPAIATYSITSIFEIEKENPYIFNASVVLIGLLISIFVDMNKKRQFEKDFCVKIEKIHFPKSYPIVKYGILPSYRRKSHTEDELHIKGNHDLDSLVKPPIEYTNEVLSKNTPPNYLPNAKYLEEIYSKDISHIVAITAENPNLWINPALSFYLINTCIVSLYRKINETKGLKNISMKNFDDKTSFDSFEKEASNVLEKLSSSNKLDSFEFIRFIMFNDEHHNCLRDSVFPALKATQDLFRIKSYFINKREFQEYISSGEYKEYLDAIDYIWNAVLIEKNKKNNYNNDEKDFKRIIEERKIKKIPEFLLLFYKNGDIVIHTYVLSYDERIIFYKSDEEYQNVRDKVCKIIRFLAIYRKVRNDFVPSEMTFNSKNSFIDWN